MRRPVRERGSQLAAQLGRVGLCGELVDQRVLNCWQAAPDPFAAFQQGQPLGGGQRVAAQIQGAFEVSSKRVEHVDDLFPTTRTHVRILSPVRRWRLPEIPHLWIKLQVWKLRAGPSSIRATNE